MRRISLLAQKNAPLRLAFSEGELTVSAQTPDVGEAREAMPVPFQGEPFEIGFNPEFLRDGLESVDADELVLKLISPLRPGLIEAGDGERLPVPDHADPAQRVRSRTAAACRSRASRLRDFRSYAAAEVALGPGLTVVHGRNGAGKTNLLEALYFGCTGRSCRTAQRARARALRRAGRARGGATRGRRTAPHELAVGFQPGRAASACASTARGSSGCSTSTARPLVSVFLPDRLELSRDRRRCAARTSTRSSPRSGRRAPARAARTRARSRSATRCSRASAPAAASRASLPAGTASWRATASRCATTAPRRSTLLAAPFAQRRRRARPRRATPTLALPAALARRDAEELAAELAERLDGDLERGFTGHGPHRDELVAGARRARAARLRLAGRAAPGAAGAAAGRARGARRRARRAAADAARRRDERARRRAAASCSPSELASRRAERDHDDRPRPRPGRRRRRT